MIYKLYSFSICLILHFYTSSSYSRGGMYIDYRKIAKNSHGKTPEIPLNYQPKADMENKKN